MLIDPDVLISAIANRTDLDVIGFTDIVREQPQAAPARIYILPPNTEFYEELRKGCKPGEHLYNAVVALDDNGNYLWFSRGGRVIGGDNDEI